MKLKDVVDANVITKFMVLKNTYMYLACKLEVHMQVVSK